MRRSKATLLLLLFVAFAVLSKPGTRSQAQAEENADDGSRDAPKIEDRFGGVPPARSTDAEFVLREAESGKTLRKHAEKFEFQAEVSRLMDIIINSLYSNKDIFLRELISNASDALDKIRFLSLTDKTLLGEGNDSRLEIEIKVDKEKNILSIRDRGVGMTKEDLIKNLGTIARSGTSAFLEQMQKGGDLNLIGQFGVGFYSVYLVADHVEVISKHNDDQQYIWESKADGAFAVVEDKENEPLGRGTEIRLHLKKEANEYAQEDKLRELVKKYSEFINFPIKLWAGKDFDVEVPVEEDTDETEEESKDSEETVEEVDEEDLGEKKPQTKKVKETKWDWEIVNEVKAIWLRSPKEVSEDEYSKFYHTLAKDFGEDRPLSWTHFNAEGDVEFKAILFIPPKAPYDLFENYYNTKATVKLFVRRVFITDEFDDLLPKYLSFLKGIVDSDSLPVNVSREMLQQHSTLKTIKKKLVRKALDMIRRIYEEDSNEFHESKNPGEEAGVEKSDKTGKYGKFWTEFGKAIKLGIIEDAANRVRLSKLLRFQSSKSGDKFTSLDQYVQRMKPGQKQIYYITGQSREELEVSPFLEKLLKKGYEIIYFTDPIDEYLMQNLSEYEDKKFQNVSKDDLKISSKGEKAKIKELKDAFKELTNWWKNVIPGDRLESVKVSSRLSGTPAVVVTSKFGWSANMERIMQAQTLSDPSKQGYMRGKRILEINPAHPIIINLRERVENDPEDRDAKQAATLIYETALLQSGFVPEDSKDFASRIYSVIKSNLNLSPDAEADVEEEVEVEENVPSDSSEHDKESDRTADTELIDESFNTEEPVADNLELKDEL